MKKRKYNYIDLFAGAGGLSEGFIMQGGFNPIAHVEMNESACFTLKTRLVYHYLKLSKNLTPYYSYLKKEISRDDLYSYVPQTLLESVVNSEITSETIESIFSKIDKILMDTHRKKVDIIVGGPPCQAYSLIGRSVSKDGMSNDPRNLLYLQYLLFIKRYNPNMFVFENVPGILTANKGKTIGNILRAFKDIGYKVDYKILNAQDFGVLQNRKRVILIGWKSELDLEYPDFERVKFGEFTVKELLEDLVPVSKGEECNKYKFCPNEYLTKSGIRTNSDVLTWHVARKTNDRDAQIYKQAIEKWNNEMKRIKYDQLPEELVSHQNTATFLDRFKVLSADLNYSHTMMAHIAKDGHYYIHPDITQLRSITVREAARIQGFPDSYFFEGSRTAAFMQIGNAVPPLMSKIIAEKLHGKLQRGLENNGKYI